ncbi:MULTISPECIES: AI-2E family transporter [Sphingobacterium]|uniref:AI-2E family transporter n=1 Tax=Sphingobacterium paramultivorum TaxID=2886510 RepID=A0A7G5E9E9_9SPHI|nr:MULTISPECIES: AI-2E family transporter [Sphingobacterium]MBB1647691.1 AI-2E family transporter [Sphingobacterium sp. UME9]MCS4167096.1 putative PurR-regulated permease PerM [Sphingobacterium sp. BIGb0116]QMV70624.1 AI-2E family transporter [Sphingobacterium paramultivorum]WET71680.1 MAG: AI-2E family transporter [Sphingobacterium sp.]WSO14489.1 AI-2E family transporter [Sphingobacterium paramultivorum]
MKRFLPLPFYVKLACILISILLLGYLAKIGDTILIPMILGLLFSLLLIPLSNFLERRLRFPRTLAGILSVILFFGVLGYGLFLLASQLTLLKEDFPAFKQQIMDGVGNLQTWVSHQFGIQHKDQIDFINKTASKSVDSGTLFLGTALVSLSSLFILFVFTFLYTFFLLIYRGHIVKFLLFVNRVEDRPIVLDVVKQVQYVVKKYLIGLLIQMSLVSLLVFITLSIIGVKYSLLLALITGVFNVLPYVGIFSSMLIIAILTFATSSFTHVVLVMLALIIVHLIDSNFIVPKIVGSKVKVNSLFAMLSIIIGEMIWGISGMFLAIPILAIVKIVMDRIKELKPWGFLLGEEDSKDEVYKDLFGTLNPLEKKIIEENETKG